ncbi:MAG: PAS domain S-box protein [Rhizobiaceae bacterium]|nr:PAS domain S-box protein [Rhizobiaceae bacterium]
MHGGTIDLLFERALDAVIGMDLAGRVIAWNASAEDTFGWSKDEAMGQFLSELIIPQSLREAHQVGLKKYLDTGEGPVLNTRINISAVHRDGHEFPIELSIIPVPGDQGTVFYGFLRSLQEQEHYRRQIGRRASEAEMLLGLSEQMMSAESADSMARYALRKVCEATGWPVGHLYVGDDPADPQRLLPSQVWYTASPKFDRVISHSATFVFERGEGLPGRAWAEDDVVVIADINSDGHFLRAEGFKELGLVSGFAFPVREAGRVVAIMEFFSEQPPSDATDLETFARTISGHVSVALERKNAAQRREILSRELAHRVGNSLAVLASIFRRCYRISETKEELRDRFEPRLMAIGNVHNLLTGDKVRSLTLKDLLDDALNLIPEAEKIRLSGPDLVVRNAAASALALVLHELTTNSLKHGAAQTDGAEIVVHWSLVGMDRLRFEWLESSKHNGGSTDHKGYGSVVIEAMISSSLRGSYTSELTEDGYRFAAELPASHFDLASSHS